MTFTRMVFEADRRAHNPKGRTRRTWFIGDVGDTLDWASAVISGADAVRFV